MYTGHVGIALAARGVRRELPLWVAVLASQAPDWIEAICGGLGAGASAQMWSHAFPFVLLGAGAAAILVRLRTRSPGAALLTFAVYLSHPLVDLVTGYKPLWLGGPPVGLQLIDRPILDFVVQGSLCLLGWVLYRRSLPPPVRGRVVAAAPLVTLLAVQAMSDLVVFVRKPLNGPAESAAQPGTGDGRRAAGDGRRATGDGRRVTAETAGKLIAPENPPRARAF